MYILEKEFKIPIGHRLSCHKGLCKNTHGHQFKFIVAIQSLVLNENNMVMDFTELKGVVNRILDGWDHGLFINENDEHYVNRRIHESDRVVKFKGDPTSEKIAEVLFKEIKQILASEYKRIDIIFVKVYETDTACSVYIDDSNKIPMI